MTKNDKGEAAWERQKGESPQAYKAFSTYRDLGEERSQQLVSQQLGKSRQLISRWSSQWNWIERVRLYDNSLQREAYKKAVKGLSEMHTRHIKTAVLMQKKAVEALSKLEPEQMSPKDIKEFVRMASELERISRHATIHNQEEDIEDVEDVHIYLPGKEDD